MEEIFASKLYNSSRFHDREFESYVRRFMDQNMPGFPLGLLSDEHEAWEVMPRRNCQVRSVQFTEYECQGCSEVVRQESRLPEPAFVCDCSTEDRDWYKSNEELFLVYNTDTDEYLADVRGADYDVKVDDDAACAWVLESDAEEAAEEYDAENQRESYAFPWAHAWVFMPDRRITDEMLAEAGYVVATYTPRRGDSYRLCGVDGGGYSFTLHHHALLAVIVAEKYEWPVPTDHGERLVTRDERSVLEKMASIQSETPEDAAGK